MAKTVDLNADMGESFGPWVMGNDSALLDIVTSANIACGFHAGDADVMAGTMRLAVEKGVGIGAHPGFADLQGFGRRRLTLSVEELANLTAYQLGAAQAMARAAGGFVRHLKLHGALANMASEEIAIDWNTVVFNMLTISGIYGRRMYETWYKMTVMIEAGLDIAPVITHRYKFAEYEQGFAIALSGESGKVILEW